MSSMAHQRHDPMNPVAPRQRTATIRLSLSAFLVALPAVIFYAVLFRKALNLPSFDDYGLLQFLNKFTELPSASEKASYFLASQHNEYKLFFARAIGWLQLDLSGQVNFKVLCVIGNSFIALLAILLWKMFLPAHKNMATRLALFIPVSWLLFQLQYWGTVNSPFAGLQNLPVFVFSFAAIYLLMRKGKTAFCGAVLFLMLAVAASGNGFLLIPIGLLILAAARSYARIFAWLAATAVCIAAYAYHYNAMSSQADHHRSVFAALLRINPVYILAFIGCAGTPSTAISVILGCLICGFFIFMALRGYTRKNPLVSYCVLFLLLTAIGVAGIRSQLGIMQSLQSRYTIYSVLLLIFAWFAIVEEFPQIQSRDLLQNGLLLGTVLLVVVFSLFMDGIGSLILEQRARETVQAMSVFEHSSMSDPTVGPMPAPPLSQRPPDWDAVNHGAGEILLKSIKLGIYYPRHTSTGGSAAKETRILNLASITVKPAAHGRATRNMPIKSEEFHVKTVQRFRRVVIQTSDEHSHHVGEIAKACL
jgi:uncharacterized membrane protein YecN with MAPEG domain